MWPRSFFAGSTSRASSKCSGRRPTITRPRSPTAVAMLSGMSNSPKGSVIFPPETSPGRKFMGGVPMKPATNRLTGCS
ncbi:Uncharacterised protein [Mycobacteroides abscessus]|nr:Uncharacterised protein [Mycobacteroides abscessus]